MFLTLLAEISEIFRAEVHAYSLMVNHYHLLVRTPDGGLSRAMRHLDGVYTQRYNRRYESDGPLFRGRYKSLLVDADAYLARVSRYIHLNPVSAEIVTSAEDYKWSSYSAYLGLQGAPDWLHIESVLEQFGGLDGVASYRDFVESGVDEELVRFYRGPERRSVLGRVAFRREVDRRIRPENRSREIPERIRVRPRPPVDAILAAVSSAFEAPLERLKRRAHRHQNSSGLARGAVVHLARTIGGCGLTEIARAMGYGSYAGASSARRRFLSVVKRDASIRAKLALARRLMNQNET